MVLKLLKNGYLPLLPILSWNLVLTAHLPPAFQPGVFNEDIPFWVLVGENLFRVIVFLMPLFLMLNIRTPRGRWGLVVCLLGVVAYGLSWLVLILAPESNLGSSVLGFAAPAYTPIIWLIGMALMADSYYFRVTYSPWHFAIPALGFSLFHIYHAWLVYGRFYA